MLIVYRGACLPSTSLPAAMHEPAVSGAEHWPAKGSTPVFPLAQLSCDLAPPRPGAHVTVCSMAVPWMDAFLQAVTPANRPDALALHYYGVDSSDFIAWTSMMHRRYGLDVWVTEVASTSQSMSSVQAFQTAIMQWADIQPWIKGVFWFCVSRTADANRSLPLSTLMELDGTMGDLGNRWCRG